MAREKRTIGVPEDVGDLLDKVGNASDYISRIVAQRWREWTDALALLRVQGWTPGEILAACDVLNGYWMVGHGRVGAFVAHELEDGQRINNVCAKHDVLPARWAERVRQVAELPEIAHALVTIVEEFWTDNQACEAAIRREAPHAQPPRD